MHRKDSGRFRLVAALLSLSLLGVACGDDDDSDKTQAGAESTTTTAPVGADTAAAVTRTTLHGLLQEHVFVAADASGAALDGRTADFEAAATALGANTDALTAAFSSIFGVEVGKAFEPLWTSHIGMIVEYVKGVAAKDEAAKDKALSALIVYTKDFGKFINSALPDQPADTVAELIKTHVFTLKDMIDAQAAKDEPKAYELLRVAAQHMDAIAKPLAVSIATKFHDTVKGDAQSPAASVLDTLNSQLREHVFLAADTTGAALGGRAEEFTAAAAALGGNSEALTATITSIFAAEAGGAFDGLWKKHITFFVDYTTGLASGNSAKQNEAVNNLMQYAGDFGAFISSALPSLTKDDVTALVTTHITTLKAVVDAQAAKDLVKAEASLHQAADHMLTLAKPLSAAIVKRFPDLFPGA